MSTENANVEVITEEILLERDASIMTDEFDAAKSNEGDLPDEALNDIQKPTENPETAGEAKPESTTADSKTGDDTTAKPDEENKTPRQSKFEKRIGRMTKKQKDTERRLLAIEQENLELKGKLTGSQDTDVKPEAPKEDDFDSYTEFVDALSKHNIAQASQPEKVPDPDVEADKPANTDSNLPEQVTSVIDDILEDGAEKYADFNSVVTSKDVNISEKILSEVVETDSPDDLLYYLGKNPSEADRLNDLTPKAMAREIGKLEAKFDSGAISFDTSSEDTVSEGGQDDVVEQVKQTPKRTTKAPAPISPLDGEGSHTSKPLNQMTTKEFRAYRMKQEKKRRGY